MAHLVLNEGSTFGPQPPRKKFILCFDGTGNKFLGNAGDSNILKIYSMLDKTDGTQFHYYQPGIGTYTTRSSLSSSSFISRVSSWYEKAKDSALGITIDEHVMAGYRFLMRYYQTGDDIYLFGFSRGAYIARFLAEMLDHIGLLSAGNEELVRFVWKTFAKWQSRQGGRSEAERKKAMELHQFMTAFRETFSRPVRRIRFLGLFDTVNSVAKFETAWMERSKKFPYTARSSAIIIRHAVSIDERRAKFRQDLIYQKRERGQVPPDHGPPNGETQQNGIANGNHQPTRFRPSAPSAGRFRSRSRNARHHGTAGSGTSAQPSASDMSRNSDDEDEALEQDIEELWFPGCHADIGGGWLPDGPGPDQISLAHGPLVWMVSEAQKAGLVFMADKMRALGCYCEEGGGGLVGAGNDAPSATATVPEIDVNGTAISLPVNNASQPQNQPTPNGSNDGFFNKLHLCATTGLIHDCLTLRSTLPTLAVLAWNVMEYLPFRRMDLSPDGSGRWRVVRWPLPMGEVRDMPDDARVHGSAILRLATDPTYRPGNLVEGGGGRGRRRARQTWLADDWVCVNRAGAAGGKDGSGTGGYGEAWVRRRWLEREGGSG